MFIHKFNLIWDSYFNKIKEYNTASAITQGDFIEIKI